MLVETIRRPGARACLNEIAMDTSFRVNFHAGSLNTAASIMLARRPNQNVNLFVGLATIKRYGADVQMDVPAISLSGDPSGVRTTGHEMLAHVRDIRDGQTVLDIKATDETPPGGLSPANQVGKDVFEEQPNISTEEAEEILKIWETIATMSGSESD